MDYQARIRSKSVNHSRAQRILMILIVVGFALLWWAAAAVALNVPICHTFSVFAENRHCSWPLILLYCGFISLGVGLGIPIRKILRVWKQNREE